MGTSAVDAGAIMAVVIVLAAAGVGIACISVIAAVATAVLINLRAVGASGYYNGPGAMAVTNWSGLNHHLDITGTGGGREAEGELFAGPYLSPGGGVAGSHLILGNAIDGLDAYVGVDSEAQILKSSPYSQCSWPTRCRCRRLTTELAAIENTFYREHILDNRASCLQH
jgi:hypothetical protein